METLKKRAGKANKPVPIATVIDCAKLPIIASALEELTETQQRDFQEKWAQFVTGHPELDWSKPERQEALKCLILEIFIQTGLRKTIFSAQRRAGTEEVDYEEFGKISGEYSKSIKRFQDILKILQVTGEETTPFDAGINAADAERSLDDAAPPDLEKTWDTEEQQFGEKLDESKGGSLPEKLPEEAGPPVGGGAEDPPVLPDKP